MKHQKIILTSVLCAALVLMLGGCGTEQEPEPAGNTSHQEGLVPFTTPNNIIIDWGDGYDAGATTTEAKMLYNPPVLSVSYIYNIGNSGVVSVSRVEPATYDWTYELAPGTNATVNSDALRPCDNEKTQSLPLKNMADNGYVVTLALQENIIESYTLTAYPVGQYDKDTSCTLTDGKLPVLKGAYYYELIIQYTQGKVIYGFFIQ